MKQIIERFRGGSIEQKWYVDDRGNIEGLFIDYNIIGEVIWKTNFVDGEGFGLETYYRNSKPKKHKYYL